VRRLLATAYIHPVAGADDWRRVEAAADSLRAVVLNPASGPGSGPDPDPGFAALAARLRAARVPLLGYVDTAYGGIAHHAVIDDVERHRDWYAVDGVFLDQVASGAALIPHYRRLTVSARAVGAGFVALNPGTHPDPGYADFADLLVTFEGPWKAYRDLEVPAWTSDHPATRFCHLVHSAPPDVCARVDEAARFRHAGISWATTGTGDNPWAVLPPDLPGPR
jgi:Spherulation-specific family 4